MIRTAVAAVSGLLLMGCAAASMPAPAQAQSDIPNILILGEDADQDTVPRNSRVFRQVVNALSNQMHDAGYNVYDETAITMDEYVQDRVRRTDQEIIDIARSVTQPPIDVGVIFSIYASTNQLDYTTKVRTRIEGRLLNVKSGQRLGNFQVVSPEEWRLPLNCSRECLLEELAEHGRTLGNDLGDVLVEKLNNMWQTQGGVAAAAGGGSGQQTAAVASGQEVGFPRQYELVFDGFTADDMLDIEEYLVVFSGYNAHRPIDDRARYHSYWYESTISHAKLNRNLRKMLNRLAIGGRVQSSGDKVVVSKIEQRRTHPIDPSEW